MTLAELQAQRARWYAQLEQAELGFTETEIDGLRVKLADPAKIQEQITRIDAKIVSLSQRTSLHRQVRFG